MLQRMQGVKIKSGFWKGCDGAVINKVPFLPIYQIYVGHGTQHRGILLDIPSTHWFFAFQLSGGRQPKEEGLYVNLVAEAIKYLYKHHNVALNMEDPKVKESLGSEKDAILR